MQVALYANLVPTGQKDHDALTKAYKPFNRHRHSDLRSPFKGRQTRKPAKGTEAGPETKPSAAQHEGAESEPQDSPKSPEII